MLAVNVFSTLLIKLLPLYGLIGVGFLVGRYTALPKERLAFLVIYLLAPVIVFNGVAVAPLTLDSVVLPLFFFGLCSVLCLVFYYIGTFVWTDQTKNLLGFTAGDANVAIFGLPIALVLFDPPAVSLVVLAIVGFMLYENTLGYYLVATGDSSAAQSVRRLLRLPPLYAFLGGLLWHGLPGRFGPAYHWAVTGLSSLFTIGGMMLIGFGLASLRSWSVDRAFLGLAFLAKFVVWPLLLLLLVAGDRTWFHLYSSTAHKAFVLVSVCPLAANTVVFATQLRAHPEKAAVAVLLSTLVALIYIPVVAVLFLH